MSDKTVLTDEQIISIGRDHALQPVLNLDYRSTYAKMTLTEKVDLVLLKEFARAIERAVLAEATPGQVAYVQDAQWWLAELDQYGNPRLIDGAHSNKAGANKAFYLIGSLGLLSDKKYAAVRVEFFEPIASAKGVGQEALGNIRKAIAATAMKYASVSEQKGEAN